MRYAKLLSIVLFALLILVALPAGAAQEGELPDQVVAQYPNLFPEGIEWDAEGQRFLVSSLTLGTIFAVADDGTMTPFIEDEALVSSLGIHIDTQHNRLLVAHGLEDRPTGFLNVHDMTSGERLYFLDLEMVTPEGQLTCTNDLVTDPDGNAYVTNHCAPLIYRVDLDGNASVLVEDERLAANIGANGIEYHPDGYLLVAVTGNFAEGDAFGFTGGVLYKIPLDNPADMTEVKLDEQLYGDGLAWHPDGSLIITGGSWDENGVVQSGVFAVRSKDGWQSATVVGHAYDERYASTSAIRDGEVYKIYIDFALIGGDSPPEAFEIARVVFEEAK
jgi:sugar lactone lactonase YvrE